MNTKHAALPQISEAVFQAQIVDLAHLYGWKVCHFRAARSQRGWRTPCAADGEGYVDLFMVHPKWKLKLWVEAKSLIGKRTPRQDMWAEWLIEAGCDYRLWRPTNEDFNEAVAVLGGDKKEQ